MNIKDVFDLLALCVLLTLGVSLVGVIYVEGIRAKNEQQSFLTFGENYIGWTDASCGKCGNKLFPTVKWECDCDKNGGDK